MKKTFITTCLLLSIGLAGCQSDSNESISSLSQPEKLDIVTSFYPLAFLTKEITGDKANVINLAENKEVHHFSPSPRDIITLNDADIVIFQGSGLEPWTEDLIPQLQEKNITTLEVTHDMNLYNTAEDDEHDEHDEHNHGSFDPHTWLDPVLAQQMVNIILEEIIRKDSANSDFYTENAKRVNNELERFNTEFQAGFADCTRNEAIVSHNAFGYVARRYGFILHSIAGISTHDEPSTKLLVELKKQAQEGVTHILTEENSVEHFAQTLSRETGLSILPINALATDSEEFFSGYRSNFNNFKIALGCQ